MIRREGVSFCLGNCDFRIHPLYRARVRGLYLTYSVNGMLVKGFGAPNPASEGRLSDGGT